MHREFSINLNDYSLELNYIYQLFLLFKGKNKKDSGFQKETSSTLINIVNFLFFSNDFYSYIRSGQHT